MRRIHRLGSDEGVDVLDVVIPKRLPLVGAEVADSYQEDARLLQLFAQLDH